MMQRIQKTMNDIIDDEVSRVVRDICERNNLDVDSELNLIVSMKKQISEKNNNKKEVTKLEKPKKNQDKFPFIKKSTGVIIPWTGVRIEGCCEGLRLNHDLHTQCTNQKEDGKIYCKTCQKQADTNSSGKPTYGSVIDRESVGVFDYVNPKNGKKIANYGNLIKKLGITREEAENEASKFGLTIQDEHFEVKQLNRGRPKKQSTNEKNSANEPEKEKRGRGRPKKNHTETVTENNNLQDELKGLNKLEDMVDTSNKSNSQKKDNNSTEKVQEIADSSNKDENENNEIVDESDEDMKIIETREDESGNEVVKVKFQGKMYWKSGNELYDVDTMENVGLIQDLSKTFACVTQLVE